LLSLAGLCHASFDDETRVLQLGPLGSRHDSLSVVRHPDGTIETQTGGFRGSLTDREAAVHETHDPTSSAFHAIRRRWPTAARY
jgi:hypothetical protein